MSKSFHRAVGWWKLLPPAVVFAAGSISFVFGQPTSIVGPESGPVARPATRPSSRPTTRSVTRVADVPLGAEELAALRAAYNKSPDQWPAADWDESVLPADRHELGAVPKVVFPSDNPYSKEKVDLGRQLFFEPRLSGSAFLACVSCHHPDLGWTDGKTVSQGHQLQPLDRNAPTIMGAAFQKHLMWDGRADSLEDQALLPLANLKEMHGDFIDIEKTINQIPEYVSEFKAVFGTDKIALIQVQQAIATFERTIEPGRSRFDIFLAGQSAALSDNELHGLHLFRTKARCINCHNGPVMSDGEFHNVGLTFYRRKFEDLGRYNETKKPEDVGAFRTPTLRNLSRTSPYMHNGLFDLDGVINLYNAGMPVERAPAGDPLAPKKSIILKKLNLTPSERSDLAEFLRDALEEPRLRVRTPALPGLYGGADGPLPATRPAGPTTNVTLEVDP